MMQHTVRSGRTKSVKAQLKEWYGGKWKQNADMEWPWGFDRKELQKTLDAREQIPFRCFMIRYLLMIFEDEMLEQLPQDPAKDWLEASAVQLIQEAEQQTVKYREASEPLRYLAEMIGDTAKANGFRQEKWGKQEILQDILADKVPETTLYRLAFALHMDFEDIEFFLKKALHRTGFYLWNREEFLLYLTFRYAEGNRFEFYEKLKAAYQDPEHTALPADWMDEQQMSTMTIRNMTGWIVEQIREQNFVFALNEKKQLPEDLVIFLRQYKYLIHENMKSYTGTATREAQRLLLEFRQNLRGDELEAKKTLKEDSEEIQAERYAEGEVIVHYDPAAGLEIPAGTKFFTRDQRAFRATKNVKICPAEPSLQDVVIKVSCAVSEAKQEKDEQQYGYLPGRVEFTSDNPYLSEIHNISKFKAPAKAATGTAIRINGKIYAKCEPEKTIPEGTVFRAEYHGRTIEYISREEVSTPVQQAVWVRGVRSGEEATINRIVSCNIKGWEKKILGLGNTKISLKKKKEEDKAKGGVLYNYLYQAFEKNVKVQDVLRESYFQKLAAVLETTQLSSSKLNLIENGKEKNISRDDLLTLCFLAYASGIEARRIDRGEEPGDDYDLRFGNATDRTVQAGFMQMTGEVLNRCGFYELYAPNPYDSLLVCLLASGEAVSSFRNLWSWYLTRKKNPGSAACDKEEDPSEKERQEKK